MARKPNQKIDFKVRMTEEMRATLEKEAKRRGQSLNAEIVERLKASINEGSMLTAMTHDQKLSLLFFDLMSMKNSVEQLAEHSIWEDHATFLSFAEAVRVMLEVVRPAPSEEFQTATERQTEKMKEWRNKYEPKGILNYLMNSDATNEVDEPFPDFPPGDNAKAMGRAVASFYMDKKLKLLEKAIDAERHELLANELESMAEKDNE